MATYTCQLLYTLAILLLLVSAYDSCQSQSDLTDGADIVLEKNCSSFQPEVVMTVGDYVTSNNGLVTLDYSCTFTIENGTSIVKEGVLIDSQFIIDSTVVRSISEPLPEGAECLFGGCYSVAPGFEKTYHSIPSSEPCVIQLPPIISRCELQTNCSSYASCTDGDECVCLEGLIGNGISCFNISDCPLEDGSCYNCTGFHHCICHEGFEITEEDIGLMSCRDVNECESAKHSCSPFAYCNNTMGGYICSCQDGYTGDGLQCDRESPTVITDKVESSDNLAQTILPMALVIGVVLMIVVVLLCAILVRRSAMRHRIHVYNLNPNDKLDVTFLPVDAATDPLYFEPDEESIIDRFEPNTMIGRPRSAGYTPSFHTVVSWSSMPVIMDDIYCTIVKARMYPGIHPSESDDGRYFNHIETDPVKDKQTHSVFSCKNDSEHSSPSLGTDNSNSGHLSDMSDDKVGDENREMVSESEFHVYLNHPNHEDDYVVLSYSKDRED